MVPKSTMVMKLNTHTHIHTTHTHIYIYTYMHTHIHAHTYIQTFYTHTSHTHIHIHTYTHTLFFPSRNLATTGRKLSAHNSRGYSINFSFPWLTLTHPHPVYSKGFVH